MESASEYPTPAAAQTRAPPTDPTIGIDPGLQRTGYAILTGSVDADACRVIEAGVIRLDPRQALEQRLLELEKSLEEVISAHQPRVLACEQLYAHYRHPRTAIVMAHARGVILALAARRGLTIINVAATHVKKHLTGSGRASKAQVQRAVAAALHLPRIPEPDDVADAMAVALCGLHLHDLDLSEMPTAKGGRP
jgi:crossover junction endodeoxyribonuclease RuvC